MPPKTKITHKKKTKSVPRKYVPKNLTEADKKKQIKSIINKTERPQLKSAVNKRSTHASKFEKKFGYKVTSNKVSKNIIKPEGIKQILDKGRGAYYSSGSRPNQTPSSWAYARLASVIMNGPARKVDKKIWDKYKIKA